MKYNVCFVLGGPGVGKGTVCEQIVREYGFTHLSAGELLRQARDMPNSVYADKIQMHMKNGTIVPAQITCDLLHEAMLKTYHENGGTNFLVDGFPRNEDNRVHWDKMLGPKTELKRVLFLQCPDDVCIKRCMARCSGRVDDNIETLINRLQQFRKQCLPIIQYYQARDLVSIIDGNMTKENVFTRIRDVMDSLID